MDSTRSLDPARSSKIDLVLALLDTQAEASPHGPRPITIGSLPFFRDLEDAVARRGWRLHRSFDSLVGIDHVTVIWDLASFGSLPRHIRAKAQGRIIGFCLESPLIAHRAYHRLPSLAQEASHLFLFPGALNLVPAGRTETHPIFWPNATPRERVETGDEGRSFLVMIASNKRAHRGWDGMQLTRPRRSIRMIASRVVARSYSCRRKWEVPDLYSVRLAAISHFAGNPGFNLYGMGWDKPVPQERHHRKQIDSCYRGPIADKDLVMGRHRFALCFENTIFPGYVTEKIFDCFFAGTIPVYLGAPDIERYIPRGSYIDARDFESFGELEDYLTSLDDLAIEGFRQRMREFVESDRFCAFTSRFLVDAFLNAVEAANTSPRRKRDSWG